MEVNALIVKLSKRVGIRNRSIPEKAAAIFSHSLVFGSLRFSALYISSLLRYPEYDGVNAILLCRTPNDGD